MNADPYTTRQRVRDAQYRNDYEAWIKSLPPEERRQLKAQGLDAPSLPGMASGMSDAASSSRARCEAAEVEDEDEEPFAGSDAQEPDFCANGGLPADGPAPAAPAPAADPELLHALLRRLVGELIGQSQAKLSLECLALVTGLAYTGASMTEIGRRHGVTRAAVSKRCVELTSALGLKPCRAMRSLKARQACRSSRFRHLHHQHHHQTR